MEEIGVESSLYQAAKDRTKTIEICLGKPEFLKFKPGDAVILREDIWENEEHVSSKPTNTHINITQILYFENLEDAFSSINFHDVVPAANTVYDALSLYRDFYSEEDEEEYGVITIAFELIEQSN